MGAPDPQTVREIAQEVADIALHDAVHVDRWITAVIDNRFGDECKLLRSALHTAVARRIAVVKPSWPAEQPQDAQPERDGDVRVVTRVWLYGTDEHHSEHAYTTIEAAQADAIEEYDPTLAEYPEYWSWEPCPPQDGRLAMLCGDDRTGYTVYPVTVVQQSIALDARDAKAAPALVCNSRLHPDFADCEEVRCELPDSHAWHCSGERTWTP